MTYEWPKPEAVPPHGSAARVLDGVPILRLWKQIPFLSRLLRVRPPEHRIGELLSKLDPGLVERIDAVHLAGVDRRDLEEHEERAEVPRVHPVDVDREIRPAAASQGARGRPLLDREIGRAHV